jgi:hypothetical protein
MYDFVLQYINRFEALLESVSAKSEISAKILVLDEIRTNPKFLFRAFNTPCTFIYYAQAKQLISSALFFTKHHYRLFQLRKRHGHVQLSIPPPHCINDIYITETARLFLMMWA